MSANLRKQFPKFEVLAQLKSLKAKKVLLKELSEDPDFCKAVREIAKNTVNKNISLTLDQKKRLRRYKKVIFALGKKRKSQKATKVLVQQTGTGVFLPIVVPLVASIIADLISR